MNNSHKTVSIDTQFIPAPLPTDPEIPPSIYGVKLAPEQKVEWKWLELPDGNRVVTSYKISKAAL